MKKSLYLFVLVLMAWGVRAQAGSDYLPLDASDPVSFYGDHILYDGQTIRLNAKAIYVDGTLSDETAARYPFVYNDIRAAMNNLTEGTESDPMTLYIAPYVYWVDDPDDPSVRVSPDGGIPYGFKIKTPWIRFQGLNKNPENVVLASDRGQTHGASGNFTMLHIDGKGAFSENITFGNYCNIDLQYPLLPELNRTKRANAIVQAQLIITNADKVLARNTRFVSRLNLCPFAGARRALFDRCYFESTDDALCGTGVYLDCRFQFYGSKPFFQTTGTGAVFLNCDFESMIKGEQYLTKAASPVTLVDCRYHNTADPGIYIGWTNATTDDLRCYQYNVTLNGEPILVERDKPWLTVDMTNKGVLNAYRVEYNGQVIYNTYNLLRGTDDWDPMNIKSLLTEAGRHNGTDYTSIPTYIKITPVRDEVQRGGVKANLFVTQKRFAEVDVPNNNIQWSVAPADEKFVSLSGLPGNGCEVTGTNDEDDTRLVRVLAKTESGLESASVVTSIPDMVEPPAFLSAPVMKYSDGKYLLDYQMNLNGREDHSVIDWYRYTQPDASDRILVAVTRFDQPEKEYVLTAGDVGYHLMATIAPKHLRSEAGTEQSVKSSAAVSPAEVVQKSIVTDFRNFPAQNQPLIKEGFWTVDSYKPLDTEAYNWSVDPQKQAWYYGTGYDAAVGTGLMQDVRGARLLYTAVGENYGDMTVRLNVDPCKALGQGFGSATGQYMDIYIKFDTRTLSGYGLRITRTTKHHNAVDFILMKYENGESTEISAPVSSTTYRANCDIVLKVEGGLLLAHVTTTAPVPDDITPDLVTEVNMQEAIAPNTFGGTGIQHTGSTWANSTMLHRIEIEWK